MSPGKEFYTFRGYEQLNKEKNFLTSSMEDYLEMIYRLCKSDGYTRINQIAEALHVQAPSATKTVQKLSRLGFIKYEKYGVIQLTPKGKKFGLFLLKRHTVIEEFLTLLGVKESLQKDTEMIEHVISIELLDLLTLYSNYLKHNPEIIKKFNYYKSIERQ